MADPTNWTSVVVLAWCDGFEWGERGSHADTTRLESEAREHAEETGHDVGLVRHQVKPAVPRRAAA